MSEETISGTGRYPALGSADLATPYRAPGLAARPGADATPASQVVAEPAKLAAVQPAKQPSAEEINSAIAVANANLSSSNRTLDYRVDAVTGISIAMIRNSQTGVVVQQMPGADIIALARMLADWAPGKHMLLDLIA